jgi:hypothetical protein
MARDFGIRFGRHARPIRREVMNIGVIELCGKDIHEVILAILAAKSLELSL